MSQPGKVVLDRDGPIGWITINNVARHNAMSATMWGQLKQAVDEIGQDPQMRVIVLRGEGDKAFVSGADISEFGDRAGSKEASEAYSASVDAAEGALIASDKPVIAMIRGICMGGGLGLAVSSDLRYGTLKSRFRMPAARLGLGYGLNNMRRIVDAIGKAAAADIFYTARIFDGAEAQRIGLLHRAVDDDALEPLVRETAQMIAENAPLTIRAARLAIAATDRAASEQDVGQVSRALVDCANSDDYTEGRTAFMEKRAPQFRGQ